LEPSANPARFSRPTNRAIAYIWRYNIINSRPLKSSDLTDFRPKSGYDGGQDFGKNLPQLFEDQAEVVSCCAEDGVGFVTGTAFQEIPSEMAIIFRVSDDRFDGGSSFQFLFDLVVNPAFLA